MDPPLSPQEVTAVQEAERAPTALICKQMGLLLTPCPVNGASMRWKDSLGPNLTETRVSNSF